jgi:hypothetical protein
MKNGKSLLMPFIIMVVLLIGVVLFFAVSKTKDSTLQSDQSLVNALYINPVDVKTITAMSSEPDLPVVIIDVVKKDDGTMIYSYNGTDSSSEVKYSDIKMSSYISVLTDYSAATIVSENSDLSEFGLDKPRYTVTIETVS